MYTDHCMNLGVFPYSWNPIAYMKFRCLIIIFMNNSSGVNNTLNHNGQQKSLTKIIHEIGKLLSSLYKCLMNIKLIFTQQMT